MAVAPKFSSPPYPENYQLAPKAAGWDADTSDPDAPSPSTALVPKSEELRESLYVPRLRSLAFVLLTLGLLYLGAFHLSRPHPPAGAWRFHHLNFAIALSLLLLSYTPSIVRRLWREAALVSCIGFIASTAAISLYGGNRGALFIVVVAVMISASLVPWNNRRQAAVAATGLLAFALATFSGPGHDPALWTRWFGLLAAAAIAQINVDAQRRSQRELQAHLDALDAAQRTQRKIAENEAALQESEEILGKLFNASLDAMAVIEDRSGILIDVNREFLRVTGFSRDEVIGHTIAQLKCWGNEEQRNTLIRQLHERGEAPDMEFDLHGKDGRVVPCLLSAVTVKIGARTLLFAITRDISERQLAERKLAENAATLRKLFEASPDVITINRLSDGAYVDVSESFDSTGFRPEEALGHTAAEIGLWTDRPQLRRFDKALREHGSVRGMEIEIRTRDGAIVPSLISATVVEINGEPCVASFIRDISRLKRTENELRAAREAALAASRAKSEFLSNMSHEIRTPMNAILGMTELMRDTEVTSEQQHCLDMIDSNGSVLLSLINDILDLARVESGRLSLESTEFDLVELVEDAADSLAVNAHEKGLELALRFAGGVPRRVVGDPMRLRQIITNLAANAVKFTERGEVVITVAPQDSAQGPGSLRFSFSDTGVGISAQQLSTIFSPFTQGDSSTSRKYGGSGLGLAIVDRLVALMGGKISVESAPGRGSVFTFTAQFAVPETAEPPHESIEALIEGVRILAADESAINRQILREMLPGALLTECASAADALIAIENAERDGDPFRIILVDSRMGAIDGFETVKRLRAATHTPGTAIVMLCSTRAPGALAAMHETGLDAHVFKPLKRRDLLAAIAPILGPGQPSNADNAARKPAPQALGEPLAMDQPLKILLADDSEDNRVVFRAFLRKAPYIVEEASDGRTALEMFHSRSYDLVLMDAQMPGMDGYTAVRAMREWEAQHNLSRTPIVALTASAFVEAIQRAIEAGCDLHVSKPVTRKALLETIAGLIEKCEPAPVEIDEDLRELVPGFIEHKRADTETILGAIEAADFRTAASLAHKLKGEGGTYGLERISGIGAELEQASKARDADRARALAVEISRYLRRVKISYRPAAA